MKKKKKFLNLYEAIEAQSKGLTIQMLVPFHGYVDFKGEARQCDELLFETIKFIIKPEAER